MDTNKIADKHELTFWNMYSNVYPRLRFSKPYKELIGAISRYYPSPEKTEKWLDAGCGSGLTMGQFLKHSPLSTIHGIDFCENMLSKAKLALSQNYLSSRYTIEQHDLSNRLPFDDEEFDGVVSNLVLPYVLPKVPGENALQQILKELNRVLKPGSQIVWSSPKDNVRFFSAFVSALKNIFDFKHPSNMIIGPVIMGFGFQIQRKGKKKIYTFLDENGLTSIMRDAGFVDISICKSFSDQVYVIAAKKSH